MTSVLHVVPSLARRDGGPSAAVGGMCRSLAALGVPTLVAATDADGPGHLDVALNGPVTYEGMTVRFFRCQFSERFKYSAPLGRWLERHVTDHPIVHVHAVFSHASVAAGRACRRAGVPYILRPLGSIDPRSLDRHAARKRILMRLGASALLDGAARIHFTSDEEERRARLAFPNLPPGVVIPLGVSDDLFAPPDVRTDDGPLVTLSRLDPIKGLDLVIRAFHDVCPRYPARRLVIAGDGDPTYVRELQALADSGPGAGRIDFAGWIDGERRARLLAGASLFLMLSKQENFGLAMVEAMATGAPVVIADTLDLSGRVAIARAGWVTSRSAAALARAMDESLSDAAERRQRGLRAREFAEEFRWPSVGARLIRLYDELSAASLPVPAVSRAARAVGPR